MLHSGRAVLVAGLAAVVVAVAAAPVAGQEIAGRVTAKDGAEGLEGATVMLVDTLGQTVGLAHADHLGRFSLHAPEAGWYALYARRIGYAPTLTDWIGVRAGMTVTSDLALDVLPVKLQPVEVKAERRELRSRKVYGMDARTIAGNIITPLEIEAHAAGARGVVDLLESQHITWLRFPYGLCVASSRTGGYLKIIVDDIAMMTSGSDPMECRMALDWLSPADVEWMMVIRPIDATVLFGTEAGNGVLLVYTKGYRPPGSSQ